LRDTLTKEGLDCPESVELNRWPRVLLSNQSKFSGDSLVERIAGYGEDINMTAIDKISREIISSLSSSNGR
jgi:hypothetical protein